MDILARKKLLLRKYNTSLFSHDELDFFAKINATEITALLKDNPHLRQCPTFFQHTNVHQLEKIIASVFQPDENFVKCEVFNVLVGVLRNSTMLLEICFKHEDFNYMSLFGFLEEDHVDYTVLVLFEDVLLPFIRKCPSQILEILANDDLVQSSILRRIYQKPIFKMMYTVIFCLSKRHSQTHKEHVKKIIQELAQTPLTYLLHKEKHFQQKISFICQEKTQLKKQTKIQTECKSPLPIHTKKVRPKNTRGFCNSQSPKKAMRLSPSKLKSKQSLGGNYQIRTMSGSSQSIGSLNRIRPKLSLQINQFQQFPQQELRSITSIQRAKSMVFNEDLDYSDLSFNLKELLSDIAFNLKSVDVNNFLLLLEHINQTYIDQLLLNCQRFIANEEYEGYCQGAICILIELVELYKAAVKLAASAQDSTNGTESSTNNETDSCLNSLVIKLQKHLNIIASKIPSLVNAILENDEPNALYSSGQRLKRIGMTKFRMLELIECILQLMSKHNPDNSYPAISLQVNFSQFDLFLIVKKYLTTFKWNNLAHCVLMKLTKLSLQQDYQNFKKKYIEDLQNPKDGILGTLMQIFRNKKFVFLKNMHFTNNGNVYTAYEISKSIIEAVRANNDYDTLISKFPAYDDFVGKDLIAYEQFLKGSEIEVQEESALSNLLSMIPEKEQIMDKACKTSIQISYEFIEEIQNQRRWVTPSGLAPRSLDRKQLF